MALYSYQKHNTEKRSILSYASYTTLTIGALLLFFAFYPVVSFELYSRLFLRPDISPVNDTQASASNTIAREVWGAANSSPENLKDFTQASVWFPLQPTQDAMKKDSPAESIDEYYLSIPKLNIEDALVRTKGEDLSKSLIHYLPTSYPGEYGNVAILGHSTLPQLYDSRDYKTIFTYLPSLNKGDRITIRINNTNFAYEVSEMFVVKPEQISVLEQKYDDSYLTLITCVPPGTYWNRLVVRARLSSLPTTSF